LGYSEDSDVIDDQHVRAGPAGCGDQLFYRRDVIADIEGPTGEQVLSGKYGWALCFWDTFQPVRKADSGPRFQAQKSVGDHVGWKFPAPVQHRFPSPACGGSEPKCKGCFSNTRAGSDGHHEGLLDSAIQQGVDAMDFGLDAGWVLTAVSGCQSVEDLS
jgi:hypothetical protein